MKISVHEVQGIKVVHLNGRFDAHEVGEVRSSLADVTGAGKNKVVVDLAQVNFIDSSGLGCLVQGMKHCREAGGNLHLCSLTQPVRVIFELTQLEKAFAIYGGEAQAVQAFLN